MFEGKSSLIADFEAFWTPGCLRRWRAPKYIVFILILMLSGLLDASGAEWVPK